MSGPEFHPVDERTAETLMRAVVERPELFRGHYFADLGISRVRALSVVPVSPQSSGFPLGFEIETADLDSGERRYHRFRIKRS